MPSMLPPPPLHRSRSLLLVATVSGVSLKGEPLWQPPTLCKSAVGLQLVWTITGAIHRLLGPLEATKAKHPSNNMPNRLRCLLSLLELQVHPFLPMPPFLMVSGFQTQVLCLIGNGSMIWSL